MRGGECGASGRAGAPGLLPGRENRHGPFVGRAAIRHHMVPDLNSLPLPIFTLQPLDQFKQVGLRLRQTKALIESIDGQLCDLPPIAVVLDTLTRACDRPRWRGRYSLWDARPCEISGIAGSKRHVYGAPCSKATPSCASGRAILSGVRARMLAVPSRAAQRLPHMTAHDVGEIDREIRDALSELSNETE